MRKLWLALTLTGLIATAAILYFAWMGNVSAPSCESLNVSLYLPGGLSNAVIYEGEIFLDKQYSDQEKLQKGQVLITPSEGPWLAGIQLTQIKDDEAFFLYSYVEAGNETLCSFQRDLEVVSSPPTIEEAFSTQQPLYFPVKA